MAITEWRTLHGDAFEGKKALVTGAAGFIGSHLCEALLDLGASVVAFDDLSAGDESNFDTYRDAAGDRLTFVKASILDQDAITAAMAGCDYVFHQAAWGSVPRSCEMPVKYHEINTTGTLQVLEAAKANNVKRVMFAASSSAYGDSETLPKIETMPILAKSPYAANKAACESLMRAYAASYGVDTVSLRYFNIFGPRQNANSAYAAVIAAFAKALIAGETPKIYGDGEQSRDFTFVDNAVHANLLGARAENTLGGAVLNVACGERITVSELAEMMAEMMGRPDLKAEHLEERAGDVKHSLAALEAGKNAIGYEPIVDFRTGLKPTVAWYEEVLKGAGA